MSKVRSAFTLIELMIVVAIIAVLAMIAVPNFTRYLAKAKRAEAYVNLHAIYAAEKAYWAEHGTYSDALSGENSVGWKPEGYTPGGAQNFYYTYGFANGSEGRNFFTGKLNTPSTHLQQAHADKDSFTVVAAGYINGSETPDILAIDQNNVITIVQDALQ